MKYDVSRKTPRDTVRRICAASSRRPRAVDYYRPRSTILAGSPRRRPGRWWAAYLVALPFRKNCSVLIIVVGNAGRITAASPRGRPRELQCRKLLRSHPTRAPRSLMPWASAAAAQAARKANDATQHPSDDRHELQRLHVDCTASIRCIHLQPRRRCRRRGKRRRRQRLWGWRRRRWRRWR